MTLLFQLFSRISRNGTSSYSKEGVGEPSPLTSGYIRIKLMRDLVSNYQLNLI